MHYQLMKGFSLTELLVAIAVSLLIGGAVMAIIPRAFTVSGLAMREVSEAVELSSYDLDLEKDFASLIPGLGFDGSMKHLSFWTMRQTDINNHQLFHVTYELRPQSIRQTTIAPDTYFSLAYTNGFPLIPYPIPTESLAAASSSQKGFVIRDYDVTPFPYFFGTTNIEEKVELTEWASPTNAPVRIETSYLINDKREKRLFYRRTK